MAKAIQKYAHPDYLAHLADYETVRDCFNGSGAVKGKGATYLPQLKGQSTEDYDNYRRRALFFPITGKTVTTMVGLATAKPPKVDAPSGMSAYFKDTETGYQFTETYVSVFSEITMMGRYGVLIDAPIGGGDPTLCPYIAENIVNWGFDDAGQVNMLLLQEYYFVEGDEKFEKKQAKRFRHCFVQGGVYQVEVLDDNMEVTTAAVTPMFSGRPIDYIPFTPYGATGIHYSVDRPPMLDIATINVSHYMSSADLEWGRHICGLPTPVISGVDSGTKLHIGGTTAWVLPVVEAKAYFMEFQGQGLQSLEKSLVEKVGLMASVSARLIDNSTRGSEAAETVRLRYMSESASLVHIINSIEMGMVHMYNMLAKLKGEAGSVTILFSREIIGIGITFKDLATLFENYFKGGLSKETLLYNMRRLEAVDPNRSDEDELAAIRKPDPVLDPNKPPPAAPTPANPSAT